jgi:2,4-dienoyl-CoA reductase-like NADH-dependent reductase (Old Yellow Enzyme family)/thioredoxin reductase
MNTSSLIKIFEPIQIGEMALKNRLVLPPMGTGYSEGGRIGPRILNYYEARAKGGTGLIITEGIAPGVQSQGPRQLILGNDQDLSGWRELVRVVHQHGGKIAVQLHHAGYEHRKGTFTQVAPSALRVPARMIGVMGGLPHELTVEEIKEIIGWHADATRRAREVGIDAVEIHAAHQYLIASFLSPASNKRQDQYGGSPENRARLLVEIIEAMKGAVGPDYPIWPRINVCEYGVEEGVTIEETRKVVPLVTKAGAKAIHASAYAAFSFITKAPLPDTHSYLVPLAEEVKKVTPVPVITVGRLDLETGEKALVEGQADLIAIGRRLIADPDLPRKTIEKKVEEIIPCIGCYECIERLGSRNEGLICTINPATGREGERKISKADKIKTVWIIGGGPAGLEAAVVAALRGHRVTLIEKGEKPGGLLNVAALPPNKSDILPWLEFLTARIEKHGVVVRLKTEATAEMILKAKPEVVLLAQGGMPIKPPIPGADLPNVVSAEEVLRGKVTAGQQVVIIGGGQVGCETAHYLAVKGKDVTVIEITKRMAQGMGPMVRRRLMDGLKLNRVSMMTETKVDEIVEGGITVSTADGQKNTFPTDTVILAVGYQKNDLLQKALEGKGLEVHCVGDAAEPRGIMEAVREGYLAALGI